MRGPFTARFANGVISAIIAVFFLAHGVLGGVSFVAELSSPPAWLLWGGVALIGVHVVVSVVTSYQQLNDAERPPSARKKRHLALKWATGALLVAFVCVHVVAPQLFVQTAQSSPSDAAVIAQGLSQGSASGAAASAAQGVQAGDMAVPLVAAFLALALAIHLCVGSKSLLKDLEIDRKYKTAFRVFACLLAATAALLAIASLAL